MNSLRPRQKKSVQKGNRGKCTPPPDFPISTSDSDGRVQRDIKEKEKAIETLSKRYGKRTSRGDILPPTILGEEEVKQVLYAVGDNHGTPSPLRLVGLT